MAVDVESRIHGTRWGRMVLEFFTNTAHFPIIIILIELLHDEILLSPGVLSVLGPELHVVETREITLKGKEQPLRVAVL